MRVNYKQLIFDEVTDAATLENIPFTGIAFSMSEYGVLLSEVEYVNGYLEGVSRDFYPSGAIWREAQMKDDLLHGEERVYYEDGSLCEWCRAVDGILQESKSWDTSGNITKSCVFNRDRPSVE